jgi:hypothetical protein
MLAMSPLVDDFSRWDEFPREAQGFLQSFGTHVVISDGGTPPRLLLNTRVPFGTELPVVEKPNGRLAGPIAMRTGKPAVSDLFSGPVAQVPCRFLVKARLNLPSSPPSTGSFSNSASMRWPYHPAGSWF